MKICKICGSEAAGYNFTVLSCGSCRAFFRRQVVENKSHICFRNESCSITPSTRTKCMACRFAKCLAVGMDPTLLQPKTSPNYLKLKSIGFYEQYQQLNCRKKSSQSSSEQTPHYKQFFAPDDLELLRLSFEAMKIVDPKKQTSLSAPNENSSSYQSSTAKLIRSLPEAFQHTETYAPLVVKYCKCFPSFVSLPSEDQLCLLKLMHTSMISIVLAFRFDLQHDGLFFDVLQPGKDSGSAKTMFLPISTYLEYKEMDCATVFRSYAYAMKIQTDGDPMLKNLIAAKQIFSLAAGKLNSLEEIRNQQATFDRLLLQYLLFKYGDNQAEAKERYHFLLRLMDDLAGVHVVTGRILASFIDEGKPVGQLNREIYSLGCKEED